MDSTLLLVVVIIAVSLGFDFVNGFHDAANFIATVVSTRVLTPKQAVAWAAFFNFVAAFTLGTGVAKTVGSGMIKDDVITPWVLLAGLLGAVIWDLATWWVGLPASSSHALIGGLARAAMAHVAHLKGFAQSFSAIQSSGWTKTCTGCFASTLRTNRRGSSSTCHWCRPRL